MSLAFHNTLTGRVERFAPLRSGEVSFYTCGPTVYDYAHIGNFRSFLAADVLRRWLESPMCAIVDPATGEPTLGVGYRVTHVMNLTDVGHMTDDDQADGAGEDKMQAAQKRLLEAKKSGALPPGADIDPRDPRAIADFYARAFLDDARLLGLKVVDDADRDPTLMPRPTGVIREMLEMILELVGRGHAYIASDGVVYYDVQSFPDYGALSGNTIERLRAGAGGRVSDDNQSYKKHPADFMLWKPDPAHLMRWDPTAVLGRDVPISEGYPGWHIECSAMARRRLGDVIDIHSGGEDNIFPHHECELAQSRGATGLPAFARYWFHPRHLFVEGEKMSKSKGNFFTIRDLVGKGFEPAAIRLELIKTHYRSNANFTEQGLRDSARMVERWRRFLEASGMARLSEPCEASDGRASRPSYLDAPVARAFAAMMDDDLNIAGALGVINKWINDTPAPTADDGGLLLTIDDALGVLSRPAASQAPTAADDTAEIESLIAERAEARMNKDFARSDAIRDRLAAMGVEIKDGPTGATWTRRASL